VQLVEQRVEQLVEQLVDRWGDGAKSLSPGEPSTALTVVSKEKSLSN